MSGEEVSVALVSLGTLIAGVVVIIVGLNYRARMRELRHKERLAMIERGLLPPPEFEAGSVATAASQRSMSLGIIVVGLGLGLTVLIGLAGGALDVGLGVGGAIAIIGAAFIVRSIYAVPVRRDASGTPAAPDKPGF